MTYTPQKEVYNILFQLLDQAITELHQENLPAVSQYDLGVAASVICITENVCPRFRPLEFGLDVPVVD